MIIRRIREVKGQKGRGEFEMTMFENRNETENNCSKLAKTQTERERKETASVLQKRSLQRMSCAFLSLHPHHLP